MPDAAVVSALKTLLADTYTLYLKTQNYHWNVTGPNFQGLHALFMSQYVEMSAAIDLIAERIRALGEKAPGSYAAFARLATLEEATGKENAEAMVKTLRDDHRALAKTLLQTVKAADATGDEGTVDLLTPRVSTHEKHAWMLDASL